MRKFKILLDTSRHRNGKTTELSLLKLKFEMVLNISVMSISDIYVWSLIIDQ